MPTPTFDQLVQFREDYVDSWNTGDKERFACAAHSFVARKSSPGGIKTRSKLTNAAS